MSWDPDRDRVFTASRSGAGGICTCPILRDRVHAVFRPYAAGQKKKQTIPDHGGTKVVTELTGIRNRTAATTMRTTGTRTAPATATSARPVLISWIPRIPSTRRIRDQKRNTMLTSGIH